MQSWTSTNYSNAPNNTATTTTTTTTTTTKTTTTTMVAKRRSSVGTGSSSSSSSILKMTDSSCSSGNDVVLPLYNPAISISTDEDFDDMSSTCSSTYMYSNHRMKSSNASIQSSDSWSRNSIGGGAGGGGGNGYPAACQQTSSMKTALHYELLNGDEEGGSQQQQQYMLGAGGLPSIPDIAIDEGGESTFVFTAKKRKNPIYIGVVIFTIFGLFLYTNSHKTLHNALAQVTRIKMQREQVHEKFSTVESHIKTLQKFLIAIDQGRPFDPEKKNGGESDVDGTQDIFNPNDRLSNPNDGRERFEIEMAQIQDKLQEGNGKILRLQRHIQEMSKKDAIKKYGSGVIRVQLELDFPDSIEGPNIIVMEMASINLMPHSVFMFLEMVDAKLFNGCSFILNAMHVIKAAPLPYDGSSASAKVKSFTKKGLESVAFREYSPEFPHEQYSIGFAADGSPSFYINTQDNADIHVGDPCFAKIVSGIDTVKRLEAAPTRNGIWYRQRIGLKRASII